MKPKKNNKFAAKSVSATLIATVSKASFLPALRTDPMALSGASRRKQIPSSQPAKRFSKDAAKAVSLLMNPIPTVRPRNIKTATSIMISFLLCAICAAEQVPFPIKPGEYTHEGWKYVYQIHSKGTRSEMRVGYLFLNGKEIKGQIGELHQGPLGNFIYCGQGIFTKTYHYNQGWLDTRSNVAFPESPIGQAPADKAESYLQDGKLKAPFELIERQRDVAGEGEKKHYTIALDGTWRTTTVTIEWSQERIEKDGPKANGKLTGEKLAQLAKVMAEHELASLPIDFGANGLRSYEVTELRFGKLFSRLVKAVPGKAPTEEEEKLIHARHDGILQVVKLLCVETKEDKDNHARKGPNGGPRSSSPVPASRSK